MKYPDNYKGFKFYIEYSNERWDDAEAILVAINITDPNIKFEAGYNDRGYKYLCNKIDEYLNKIMKESQ